MSDNERIERTQPKKNCNFCFAGPKRGVCDMVSQVENQAEFGGMPNKEAWNDFINRMESGPLPQCLFPEQLTNAIKKAEPKFGETK